METKFQKDIFFLLCAWAFFKGYTDNQSYIQISPEFDVFSKSLNNELLNRFDDIKEVLCYENFEPLECSYIFEFKRQKTRWNIDACFCWHNVNKTCIANKYNNSKRESAKRMQNDWKVFCLLS